MNMMLCFLLTALCLTVSYAAPADLHFFASEPELPFQRAWGTFKSQHGMQFQTDACYL